MGSRLERVVADSEEARRVRPSSRLGFTLLEALVVVAIILLLAGFGFPALQLLMARSKLQGSAREIAVHLGSSRVAAMRLGRNVVVELDFDNQRLVAFVDDNDSNSLDTDEKVLSNLPLPGAGGNRGVYLMGPDNVVATEDDVAQATEGFTFVAGTPDRHLAIFQPDGSIEDPGGIRISDGKDPANVFEVRVDPPATARVEILKFVYGDTRGLKHDGEPMPGSWFGQGGNLWEWY